MSLLATLRRLIPVWGVARRWREGRARTVTGVPPAAESDVDVLAPLRRWGCP